MPHYFVDSSALVKQYIDEPGSDWLVGLLSRPLTRCIIAHITAAEVSAAIVRRVDSTDAQTLLDAFDYNFAHAYTIARINDDLVDRAVTLVRRHRLKGCDGLQLAAALNVAIDFPQLTFVCSDEALNHAAHAEGLSVENPNKHDE